jgi:hypothetical protein
MAMPSVSSRGRPFSRDVNIWPLVMARHLPFREPRDLDHYPWVLGGAGVRCRLGLSSGVTGPGDGSATQIMS